MADRTGERQRPGDKRLRRRSGQAALLLALPMLAALLLPPFAAAEETQVSAPDFSAVTTKRAAKKLVREGRLVEILYFPAELGGPDEPDNVGYITPQAAEARDAAISTLGDQVERGLVNQMMVSPDYKGESIVPSRITMSARHSEREGTIELTIEVW